MWTMASVQSLEHTFFFIFLNDWKYDQNIDFMICEQLNEI